MKKVIIYLVAIYLMFSNITAVKAEEISETEFNELISTTGYMNEPIKDCFYEENTNKFSDIEMLRDDNAEHYIGNSILNINEDLKANEVQTTERAVAFENDASANIQIEAGENFTLVLKENGTVWAWGDNTYGQLGDGTLTQRGIPKQVAGLENIIYINAGAASAFAVNRNGELYAWGDNRLGQLGDGTYVQKTKPVRISALEDVKEVSAGYYHTAALKTDGTVYFWGNPKLSASSRKDELVLDPIQINISEIIGISSGKSHIAALSQNGEVYTWGKNNYGQLGNGSSTDIEMTPQRVELYANITKIESGINHIIALDNSGNAYAWGDNSYGQFGNGNNNGSNVPILLNTITDIKDIATGYNHTVLVKNNDGIYTCGSNEYGQLGDGTRNNANLPVRISSSYMPVSISGGLNHTLEINSQGEIYVWGSNINKQLGIENTNAASPATVCGLDNVQAIAGGMYHNLALKGDGSVWAWGYNSHNQLGDGSLLNNDTPQKVLEDAKSIAAGYYHSLALKKDGTVMAWGFNGYGQLGNGGQNRIYSPVQVKGLTDVKAIAAGAYHSLALKNDGTVYAWGLNEDGQLGDGTVEKAQIPKQVPNLTDIEAIAVGQYNNFAIRNDGTVFTWGKAWEDFSGQFGNMVIRNSKIPIEINIKNIKAISSRQYHTLMLNDRGEVFAFGDNGHYQYGNIQTKKLTNIKAIAAGEYHSLMLNEEGRVLACGDNGYGQLANGGFKRNIRPIEIKGLKNIKDIAAGYRHSMALKEDGTVVSWGNDGSGQLGTGKKFALTHPCLFGDKDNSQKFEFGEDIVDSIDYISGQKWYSFKVPYNTSYKFSVTDGYEIEVYKNNDMQNGQSAYSSIECRTDDNIYVKVIKKRDDYDNYLLKVSSDTVNKMRKKNAVTVNGSEYYINLYDNRCLYKDELKLTNTAVNAICSNGRELFISDDEHIYKIVGTEITKILDWVDADFIAADLNNIYFSRWRHNNGGIYYSPIGSGQCFRMDDAAGIFLDIDNTYLYYYDVKNDFKRVKIEKIQ